MTRTTDINRSGGLEAIFRPRSIAVLGVTPTPGTVPHDIFVNLLDGRFNGPVYPVSPRRRHIAGVRAYDYVLDIPDTIDLAVLTFPGRVCELALEQCGRKGIQAAIIISAGFREVGPEGRAREQRIREIAARYGMRLIGPNCLGAINTEPEVRLNASFARAMPAAGSIAFISQSGALCTAVLDYAAGRNIGFSKFVSLGNKADVDEVDLIRFLADDPQTSVILMYLEDISRGRELIEAARQVTRDGTRPKPILAIKSGRTPAGAAAAQSHTGALAGSDAVCEGAFTQAGIIRCRSLEEMFNAAQLLAHQPLPRDNRIAIITNAGGPGVMAADAAVDQGLRLAAFSARTSDRLRKTMPPSANIKNPVDVIGDARADRYQAALEAVYADEGVDQILVILTPQSMTDITAVAQVICRAHDRYRDRGRTLVCSFMGGRDVAEGIAILQGDRVPHYLLPEWACEALRHAVSYRRWLDRPADEPEADGHDRQAAARIIGRYREGYLREDDALAVLRACGFPVPDFAVVRTADEAADAAARLGLPAVLRILSSKIIHKSEVRGVALNLRTADEVRRAWSAMRDAVLAHVAEEDIAGYLVRPMIPEGREVILGVSRDPTFGHVIMFGLGGIYVEVLRDVIFRVAPIGRQTAREMIDGLRTSAILHGLRGQGPCDLEVIEDALVRLSRLVVDFPAIVELDINPLIVHPAGAGGMVADVRIRVQNP